MLRRRDEQARGRRQRLHVVLHGPHAPLVDRLGLQVLEHKLAGTACSRGGLPLLRTAFAIENLELVGLLQASLLPRPGKRGFAGRDIRRRQVGRSGGRKRAGDLVACRIDTTVLTVAQRHHAAIPARSSRGRLVRLDAERLARCARHRHPVLALITLPLVRLLARAARYGGIGHGRERQGAAVADNRRRPRRGDLDLRHGEHGAVHPLGMRAALIHLRIITSLPFHIIAQYRTHAPLVRCIQLQNLGSQRAVRFVANLFRPLAFTDLAIVHLIADDRFLRIVFCTRVITLPAQAGTRGRVVSADTGRFRGSVLRCHGLGAHACRVAGHGLGRPVNSLRHRAAHVAVPFIPGKRYLLRCFAVHWRPNGFAFARILRCKLAPFPRVRESGVISHVRGCREGDSSRLIDQAVRGRNLNGAEHPGRLVLRSDERVDLRPRRCHAVLHDPYAPLVRDIPRFQHSPTRPGRVVYRKTRGQPLVIDGTSSCELSVAHLEPSALRQSAVAPRPAERGLHLAARLIRVNIRKIIIDGKIGRRSGHRRHDGLVAVERLCEAAARGRDLAAVDVPADRQVLRGNLQRGSLRTLHGLPFGAVGALPLVGQLLVVGIGVGIRRQRDGTVGAGQNARRARRDPGPREHDLFRIRGEQRTRHPVAAQRIAACTVGNGAHVPLVRRARLQVVQIGGGRIQS